MKQAVVFAKLSLLCLGMSSLHMPGIACADEPAHRNQTGSSESPDRDGKIQQLDVVPASRRADVVICNDAK